MQLTVEIFEKILDKKLDQKLDEKLDSKLKNFATKKDLENFATKEDLKKFATKNDLKPFATKIDLKNFPNKNDLKQAIAESEKRIIGKIAAAQEELALITSNGFENVYSKLDLDYKVIRLEKDITKIKSALLIN
jgi:predicted membrane chloride channel (bestrophin family)